MSLKVCTQLLLWLLFINKAASWNGPLARYVKLRVAHAPRMPGTLSPPPRVSGPDMHYDTCVTHVPWCMPRSLTSGFLWSRWRGIRSRHSRRMRNPQFYVSGKRPMLTSAVLRHWAGSSLGPDWGRKCCQQIGSDVNVLINNLERSFFLNHCGKKRHMASDILVNIASGNGSLWIRHQETYFSEVELETQKRLLRYENALLI